MIFYSRLHKALEATAKRVDSENKYHNDEQLNTANAAAVTLFSSVDPVYRENEVGDRVNVSFRALWRTNRYARRKGIDWSRIDWELLLEWLYNNWETILRMLLSLLVLI